MSAKFGQITLKTRVMTSGDPLESPDGNTLLRVNDDGTATITSGGEAASTFTELAAAAGVQTVTDSTTLGDIQSGFGLSDSNTVQDAITASAGTSKQVATLDDIPAVPSDYVSKTATATQALAGGLSFPPDVEILVGDPEWTDAAVSIYAESGAGGNGYVYIGNGTRSIEISQTEISQSIGSTTNHLQFPTWSGNSSKVIATDDQLRYSFVTPAVTTSTTDSADDTVSVVLSDRAVNSVTLAAGVTYANLTLPAKITGYARDFFIRLVITADDMPAISFKEPDGSAVSFDVDDDSWADIEKGVNIIMLTETAQ